MIGGKSNAANRPSALGTMLQASTYGATIPTIHGMTRSAFLAIWAANLREGDTGKKGKGWLPSFLKPPDYVENVDFLIGSNPIEGVGQFFANNTSRYTLDLISTRFTISGGASHTIVDSNLYMVIGATAEVILTGAFNDYGSVGSAFNFTLAVGGVSSPYVVGDTFSVNGSATSDPAIGTVLAIDVFNRPSVVSFSPYGSGYSVTTESTSTLTGTGAGLQIQITSLSTTGYSGIYEFPLWNCAQHGPDLIHAAGTRWWPYVYKWAPSDGNVIHFPSWWNILNYGIPNGNSFINVYYFRKNGSTNHHPPITHLRMAFEQELGSGSEYSNAGLSAQQIIYPFYAGAGSPNIDLGVSGLLPNFRPEIKGSNCIYKTGDADFADMIEDTLKSGQLQTNAQLGLIHRGLNLNEIPGPVQKGIWQTLEYYAPPVMVFNQPIAAGTILIAMSRARPGAAPVQVSDAPGAQTWVNLYASDCVGIFYAQASGAIAAGDVVSFLYNGGGQYNDDAYILAMDPGSDTIEAHSSTNGTNSAPSLSITTAGNSYLLAFFNDNSNPLGAPAPPVHWTDVFPDAGVPNSVGQRFSWSRVYFRNVKVGGTYTLKLPTIVGSWDLVLIAISQSQASPWPVTLGNILDDTTMQNLRDQCRANGLYGSITMDSQRKAADWLQEFYMAANGAPVWSGFKLKSIARSEVSYAGNGAVYTAPTASGPVATLSASDLIGDTTKPLITVERAAQVDANNIMQIECVNRSNDYNTTAVSEPESGGIALYGPRKESPISLHEIQDPQIARKILKIEVRRKGLLRNLYKFTMKAKWIALEAMDLILINEPLLNIVNLPVRITSIKENEQYDLEVEAEPYLWGVNAPNILQVTAAAPNNANSQYIPGAVNTPVIVEVPNRMSSSSKPQMWIVVSNSDPLYGGCVAYLSLDGGSSYPIILGNIAGNATTGVVTVDWPAAADPDYVNSLSVDLTESLGALANYSAAEENNFTFPCFVGAAPTPTPTFSAYTGTNSVSPAQFINFSAPAGDGGLLLAHIRGVQGAAWFLPINDSCGGVRACTGGQPIQPVGTSCAFTCNHVKIQELFNSNSPGWNFNFGGVQVGLTNGTRLVDYVMLPLAAGIATGTLVLDEASFNYTGANIFIGGGSVMIARIGSAIPGNPDLYVAAILGTGVTLSAPSGWTNRVAASVGSISVYTFPGSIGEPPNGDYELMTYGTATLGAAYHYTLAANVGLSEFLRRSVFGQPTVGMGEDHAPGARFAFLDAWQNNPTPAGILKVDLDPNWINLHLFFKFVPFNNLGGGFGDISTALPYDYTPSGLQSGGGSTGGGTGNPGQPGQPTYQIIGGTLTQPTSTSIAMAAAQGVFSGTSVYYDARTFTIPAPVVATTYYVTIFDPSQLGDDGATPTLTAQCQSSAALVGVPGYVYIGSIVAIAAGGGTVTAPGGYPPGEQILVNGQ